MCNHYALVNTVDEIGERYDVNYEYIKDFKPVYHVNGFSFPKMPVITSQNPEYLQLFEWGLIGSWVPTREKAVEVRAGCLNAKSETIFDLKTFKNLIPFNRCLIPCSGFFEWRNIDKKKYPYFISLDKRSPFSFAGIYNEWADKSTGEIIHSFSILTCEANELMSEIHNVKKRMPVILPLEYEQTWLDTSLNRQEIEAHLLPYDSEEMSAYTISKLITQRNVLTNVPEVLDKFEYPEILI